MKIIPMHSTAALSAVIRNTIVIAYLVLSLFLNSCATVATGTDAGSLPAPSSQDYSQSPAESEDGSSVLQLVLNLLWYFLRLP